MGYSNNTTVPNSASATPSSGSSGHGHGHHTKRSLSGFTFPSAPKGIPEGHQPNRHPTDPVRYAQPLYRRDIYRDDEREYPGGHRGSTRPSIDASRPDTATYSRRGSVMVSKDGGPRLLSVKKHSMKPEKEKNTAQAMTKADERVEGLKQSLDNLNTFSTKATTRLDETYYAVLEKTSALQNTVSALRELAEASQGIYRTFEKDSKELEKDITTQLANVGTFDQHQSQIEALQRRIRDSRSKIQRLSGRVDVVRERIEGWESIDQEWQDKTRRRLRVIWSVTFILIMFVVLMFTAFDLSSITNEGNHTEYNREGEILWDGHQKMVGSDPQSRRVFDDKPRPSTRDRLLWRGPPSRNGRLRAFDEL